LFERLARLDALLGISSEIDLRPFEEEVWPTVLAPVRPEGNARDPGFLASRNERMRMAAWTSSSELLPTLIFDPPKLSLLALG
jgi:hypothetical protein